MSVLALAAAAIVAVLAGCGGTETKYVYPKASEEAWMTTCTSAAGGHRSQCECAFHWLENHVSYVDFARQDLRGELPERWKTGFLAACVH